MRGLRRLERVEDGEPDMIADGMEYGSSFEPYSREVLFDCLAGSCEKCAAVP